MADQSDVRISGVSVGRVVKLAGGPDDRTDLTLQLRARYAPVAKDTRAMLRTKTLLGETYVELTPGHPAKGTIPEGGTLPPAQIEPTVEIDEIMSTFDPATRKRFAVWMQSQAEAISGRGADINAALGQLPGFTEHVDDLLRTLDAQGRAVTKSISSTGEVFDAISKREGELRGLITDSNRLFAVTARRNEHLADIFRELPAFERESTATLPVLTRLAKDGDPVVKQLQPAATDLNPTFAALNKVSPEFKGLFTKLDDVVDASEKGLPAFNDIVGRLPSLFDAFQPFLRNANPMVQYIGGYNREISSFFGNVVSASAPRDSIDVLKNAKESVHYLRTSQLLSPEALAYQPKPIGSSRQNAYPHPGASDQLPRACPVLTAGPCSNPDAAAAHERLADRVAAVHRPARLPHHGQRRGCGRPAAPRATSPASRRSSRSCAHSSRDRGLRARSPPHPAPRLRRRSAARRSPARRRRGSARPRATAAAPRAAPRCGPRARAGR